MTPSLTPLPPAGYMQKSASYLYCLPKISFLVPGGGVGVPGKITNDSRTGYGQIVPGTIRGTKRSEEIDVVDLIFVCRQNKVSFLCMGPKSFVKCLMACESFPFYCSLGVCHIWIWFGLLYASFDVWTKIASHFSFWRNYNGLWTAFTPVRTER